MGCLHSRNQGVKKLEEDKSENFTQLNAVRKQNMPNAKHKRRREDGNNSDRPSKSSRRSAETYQARVDDGNRMHDDIQRYKHQINQLENSQSENKREIAEYKVKLQSAAQENNRLKEKLAEANDTLTRKDNHIRTLENKVDTLTAEKDKLLTRLSTIAGANLTNNNPNIADLSDSNRPTKLAERYSELYDSEWTDSFTAMQSTGIEEREGLDILRDILMDIYKLCETSAESQMKSLYKATEQLTKVDKILPVEMIKGLKEARKKNYKSFLPELTKEMDTRLKIKGANKETRLYKNRCLELCWLMCIQDPPVYMDCDVAVHGKPFSKEGYKAYTKNGQLVDYIVWPALFIHKGGLVLCKGTAQGMSASSLPTLTSDSGAGLSRTTISVKM